MPLDRDQMREYQRTRRAKQKEESPDRPGSPTLEKEPPSWEELIPKTPDGLIDKILNHPAMFDPRKHAKRDAP